MADMYEPNHLPVSYCGFSVEQLMSSHFAAAAAAAAAAGMSDVPRLAATTVSPAEMGLRHDDTATAASASAPSLRLNHSELWRRFSAVGTEMVITKSGRQVLLL